MVDCLSRWIQCESPSQDAAALTAMQGQLLNDFSGLGLRQRVTPGGHLLLTSSRRSSRRQLLLGHFDTVWPRQTLLAQPLRVEAGKVWGPGSYDMKGGILEILFALRCLQALERVPRLRPVVFLNNDEEVGSPDSSRWIRLLAAACCRCYVLEPSLGPEGRLKTSRKGVISYTIDIQGRPAHAGLDPGAGASAILELSYLIQELHGLNDARRGVSVNVGLVEGGVRANVVAPRSRAVVDVRVPSGEEHERVDRCIRGLQARVPGVRLSVARRGGRPPLEPSAANQRLWGRALHWAQQLGLQLEQGQAGGGSDGSTASQYCPTLDGLGPVGGGAHATDEHVVVSSLVERSALLTMLLLDEE